MRLLACLCFVSAAAASCKDQRGKRIPKGGRTRDSAFIYTCIEETPGDFYLQTTACIYEGEVLTLGEPVADDFYAYECTKGPDGGLGIRIIACIDPRGKGVEEGGLVIKNDYAFRCSKDRWGTGLTLKPAGCVNGGRVVGLGKTFSDKRFWYTCREQSGQPARVLGGCVSGAGKRVRSGSVFTSEGFAITCRCTAKQCSNRVTGCAEEKADGSEVPRRLGETWLQGRDPFRYTVTCKTCSLGITIVRTNTECRYAEGKFLGPGCMKRVGSNVLACGTNSRWGLQLSTSRFSKANVAKLSAKKFRFC